MSGSKCQWCNSLFKKKHNRQVYCSQECKKESRLRQKKAYYDKYLKMPDLVNCDWCGSQFKKEHNKQKYCSKKCRNEAKLEKNRTYRSNYYHKYKNVRNEEQNYGWGSGYLSHRKKNALKKNTTQFKLKRRD